MTISENDYLCTLFVGWEAIFTAMRPFARVRLPWFFTMLQNPS